MKSILLAFQFLTIIPIKLKTDVDDSNIAKSASAFVMVGLFQGILLMATDYICGRVFHPDLVSGIILFVLVLSNGGFHLEGLADTFDAIASRSEGNRDIDRQKRLSIMKDSTVGPIGVIAIVFSLGIKYLFLKNLSNFPDFTYYSALLLMPAFSKWTMVISMFHGRPSRDEGLGSMFINKIRIRETAISSMLLFSLLILLIMFFRQFMADSQYIFYLILLIIMYMVSRICIVFFNRKFGGLNGDTLGAISEITELIFLLLVIVWAQLFT